jgi:hypothetical protein
MYIFCEHCSKLIDMLPHGTLQIFLGEHNKESWVDKNIREARLRRSNGELLWANRMLEKALDK